MPQNAFSGTFTPGSYARAKQIGRKLFGDRMNFFFDVHSGLWHLGRFLDDAGAISSKTRERVSPMRRPTEIFGVGRTLDEALAVFVGPKAIYSVAGMAPGAGGARGYRLVVDRKGRVHGYESPAGVFSRKFPGEPGQWS